MPNGASSTWRHTVFSLWSVAPSAGWVTGRTLLRAIANDLGSLQADVAKAVTRTLPDVTEEQLTALRPGDVDRQ